MALNISVCSRSGLLWDLWKTSPPLSAHLGCHGLYSGTEDPGWPALQSIKTENNKEKTEKKKTNKKQTSIEREKNKMLTLKA